MRRPRGISAVILVHVWNCRVRYATACFLSGLTGKCPCRPRGALIDALVCGSRGTRLTWHGDLGKSGKSRCNFGRELPVSQKGCDRLIDVFGQRAANNGASIMDWLEIVELASNWLRVASKVIHGGTPKIGRRVPRACSKQYRNQRGTSDNMVVGVA